MTAYQYLQRLRPLQHIIGRELTELQELRESLTGVTGISYDTAKVQTSITGSQLENNVIRIVSAVERLTAQIERYQRERNEVVELISHLDPVLVEIAYLRFQDQKAWGTIAKEIGYSPRQTHRLYKRLLEDVEELIHEKQTITPCDADSGLSDDPVQHSEG